MNDPYSQYAVQEDSDPYSQYKATQRREMPIEAEQSFGQRLPRNIAAGLAQSGHNLLNAPSNLAKLLEARLQQLGGPFKGRLSESLMQVARPSSLADIIPRQPDYEYSKMVGLTGKPRASDWLVQKGAELLPEALGGASLLKTAVTAIPLRSKSIMNKVMADKAAAQARYGEQYGNLFKEAKEAGIETIAKPKINTALITKESAPAYHKALNEFYVNPTLENAHTAQSDLGKLVRKLEKSNELNPLPSPKLKALKEAKKAQVSIKDAMFRDKDSGLAKKYADITKGYREEVVPYSSAKAIQKFGKQELTAKNAAKRLKSDDAFMLAIGKKYPGLNINPALKSELTKKIMGYSLGAPIVAGIGKAAYNKLVD